jgi:hypothetical protein
MGSHCPKSTKDSLRYLLAMIALSLWPAAARAVRLGFASSTTTLWFKQTNWRRVSPRVRIVLSAA